MKKPSRFVLRYQVKRQEIPFTPSADSLTSAGRRLEGEEFERRAAELMERDAGERERRQQREG